MKKYISYFLLLCLLLTIIDNGVPVFAVETPVQAPPTQVRVEASDPDEPAIGYNEYDEYYIDIKWDVVFPGTAQDKFLNVYIQEISKAYRPPQSRQIKQRDIPGDQTSYRIKGLKPGTMYYIDMTAYHTYLDGAAILSTAESLPSNKLKVITDITLNAYPEGVNQIKVDWDDVWDASRRISYKLYVSETSNFNNTPPTFITPSEIGQDKPVSVNEATGRLEYVYTVRDAGRIYYVKIKPDVIDASVKLNSESNAVMVSSYIVVRSSKIASTDGGTIWRLEWSPVVTGLSDNSIRTSYQIYKGIFGSNQLPQYMAAVDTTNFYVTIPVDDNLYYFTIFGNVTKNGEDIYPGIKIQSDKVIVEEQAASSTPIVPELVDKFEKVSGDTIISYNDTLTQNSATLLWRIPKKGDGTLDSNVLYDIWVLNDPNLIDNPPNTYKVATSLKMTSSNYVMNDGVHIGYKYVIDNLTANSTYYVKIVAKRSFMEYINLSLQSVTYYSDPALKIVITPSEGRIEQPLVPAKPPFKIKLNSEEKEEVTSTSAVIQLRNQWYEQYNNTTDKWEYIKSLKDTENESKPNYIEDPSVLDDVYYRKVEYDSGVTISVGCIKYYDTLSYNSIIDLPANKVVNYPIQANDLGENTDLNFDNLPHNINISLTDLEPNTRYVVWVRAARNSVSLISRPSDPIIITTKPEEPIILEKPTVPMFNYNFASDNYMDLSWQVRNGYTYTIKYSKDDNIATSIGSKTITAAELKSQGYTRITGLKANTLYYFWIQAQVSNAQGQKSTSQWSDSFPYKTMPEILPPKPNGFGVKAGDDTLKKDSVLLEWISQGNYQYIIELSEQTNFDKFQTFRVGAVSEYNITGLKSNQRYYARLYAFDTEKQLKSIPSDNITVKTLRSSDEYDLDNDNEEDLGEEFIQKDDQIINGVWGVSILQTNADRLIEKMKSDNSMDYKVDLKNPPQKAKTTEISISGLILSTLNDLKENLIIETDKVNIILRPNTLDVLSNDSSSYKLQVSTIQQLNTANMILKSKGISVEISKMNSSNVLPINRFKRALKLAYTYTDSNFYNENKTDAFLYNQQNSSWIKLPTEARFNDNAGQGNIIFETLQPGIMVIAENLDDYYEDIYYHQFENEINEVASSYDLDSIEGRNFGPDNYLIIDDAVKITLNILRYDYSNEDHLLKAANAKIIGQNDMYNANSICNFDKAVNIISRIYELKTKNVLGSNKSKFISENDIILTDENGNQVEGNHQVTRGEFMYLIYKLLVVLGEVE